MIISRTPVRISFFGGGTDYPVWYREHGGAVLATSINHYAYITCRHLPPFFDYSYVVAYSQIEHARSIADIRHPIVRELLKHVNIKEGLAIHYNADLPARTGLGSSSSFTVGLLNTLYGHKSKTVSQMQLAHEAIHIEQDLIGESVGSQDQVSAAIGGFNRIQFGQDGDISVTPLDVPRKRLEELRSHLLLVFTGFSRTASDIAAEQIKLLQTRQNDLTYLGQLVDEAVDLLSSSRPLEDFGKLLHESWLVKRGLTGLVSNDRINQIYSEALEGGAIGGKLLGAGGGGFLLLFVRPTDRERVVAKLSDLLFVPFEFENSGSTIIFSDHEGLYPEIPS